MRLCSRHCRSVASAKVLLLLATMVVFASPASAREARNELEQVARSVVAVLPQWPSDGQRPREVEGSGVAVLGGGTIVTAYHVIDKALSVQIRTNDGEVMNARIAGVDPATDLAILKIDAKLPALDFSGDAEFGEDACALGHPFGFGLSMSCGVVSAVHKAGAGFNAIEDFVQTDAAVNPGMSGGALVRRDGSLIGIITSIFTAAADGNLGLNFAVATPLVRRVVEELAQSGRVRRVASGLRLRSAIRRGDTGRLAAYVMAIRPNSPAADAGIAVGDRIIEAGGRTVRKPADFVSVMGRLKPGETLDLSVNRGDQNLIITMTVGGGGFSGQPAETK